MGKTKKPLLQVPPKPNLAITFLFLFFILLFLLHFNSPSVPFHIPPHTHHEHLSSIDLRQVDFAWNNLTFDSPPTTTPLRIAVFSRKWPTGPTPGGMERHAHTLHTTLARLGHQVHVFTSPQHHSSTSSHLNHTTIHLHFHEGDPGGKWHYKKAWAQFQEENRRAPFHVIHSESVALPHWMASEVPNLVVSWHGIALEKMHSSIYNDTLILPDHVLEEIRFFRNYAHHVAISDSCGEMLRGVYRIPSNRVHVIVNGVNEDDFFHDLKLGQEFRSRVGVPSNASLVLGAAGRLVEDKGHRLLHEAFAELKHDDVYLIVVGSGPWGLRYSELGSRVVVLGPMSQLELRSFYNAIDVFVDPTLRAQGLDLTLMEAMMSGKPVMASRFPSIEGTVVVRDEFGFLFSPNVESLGEVLETVVKEGSRRLAERGEACREYAGSMFTARKMAAAYERLFLCINNHTYCMYHST